MSKLKKIFFLVIVFPTAYSEDQIMHRSECRKKASCLIYSKEAYRRHISLRYEVHSGRTITEKREEYQQYREGETPAGGPE